MQASPNEPKAPSPVGVVFDGSIGRDIDGVLALIALYGLSTQENATISVAGLSASGYGIDGAAFCEAVARFYNKLYLRDYPARFQRYRGLPIGMEESASAKPPSAILRAVLDAKAADGEPLYPHEVRELTDTAEPAALIRNALTAEEDGNAAIVLNGPATSLAAVLALNGGRALIERKVRRLVVAMGDLPSPSMSRWAAEDAAAARKLFAEWPTPVVAVAGSVGKQALFPAASLAEDFGWTEHHPLLEAYRAGGQMPYDATTHATAAVIAVGRPDSPYFELSSRDGRGRRRRRIALQAFRRRPRALCDAGAGQRDALVAAYREVIPAMPAAREGRLLKRLAEEEEKQDAERRKKP